MNSKRLWAGLLVTTAAILAMSAQAQDSDRTPDEDRLRPGKKLTAPTDQRGGTYRNPKNDKRGDDSSSSSSSRSDDRSNSNSGASDSSRERTDGNTGRP